ncbi:MAG: hypothetical protein Q4F53_08935 [Nesterenkonia sp.]|nr:hypothetical protein [Nesterenkonia sp.]
MSPRRAVEPRRTLGSVSPVWRRLLALGAVGAVTLTACTPDPEDVDGEPDGDVAIGDPGEGIERSAPEPAGDQKSQDEMAEVLREELDDPTVRTTDELLESLRDIETELRRLVVDPMECQAQVLSSGTPVPDGALVASGVEGRGGEDDSGGEPDDESDDESEGDSEDGVEASEAAAEPGAESELTATFYSYQQAPAAEGYMQTELSGLESCDEYTVTRTVDEEELETEVVSELIEVETGADDALGRMLSAEDADGERHSLAVMVRHEAQIVTLVEPLEAPLDDDEAEDRAQQLQDRAAELLGALVDEDLEEPEDDADEDDAEDDGPEPDDEDDG